MQMSFGCDLDQGSHREMLLQGGSRTDVCPNGESRSRGVHPYPTRLNTGSETACIQRKELGETENKENRENRAESRELGKVLSRLKMGL